MHVTLKAVAVAWAIVFTVVTAIAAWHFPYATDDPPNQEDTLRAFYAADLAAPRAVARHGHSVAAGGAPNIFRTPERVNRFVDTFGLRDARVLDVGSGAAYLQDVIDDYTGLDASHAAGHTARIHHGRVVTGVATAMPFDDSEFDAAWSAWVLEHVPNPEAALSEIRRVVKPGGLILLAPAWRIPAWAGEGYEARPYSDFGPGGKLVKATIPLRRTFAFQVAATVPVRVIRSATSRLGPTRLHYRRLAPDYEQQWQTDSDAVNSLDPVEVAAWFESRGDTCLNCPSGWRRYLQPDGALVIRVGPKGAATSIRNHREDEKGPRLLARRPGPGAQRTSLVSGL